MNDLLGEEVDQKQTEKSAGPSDSKKTEEVGVCKVRGPSVGGGENISWKKDIK